jgi:hypothetical protein
VLLQREEIHGYDRTRQIDSHQELVQRSEVSSGLRFELCITDCGG